jgi:hypothetical protein
MDSGAKQEGHDAPAILNLLLLAQASRFGVQAVEKFWRNALGGKAGPLSLLEHMSPAWRGAAGGSRLPEVLEAFHRDLLERGLDPRAIIREEVYGQFGPCILEPGAMLQILNGFMPTYFRDPGCLPNIYLILKDLARRLIPSLKLEVELHWSGEIASPLHLDLLVEEGSGVDLEPWLFPLLEKIPELFGMPRADISPVAWDGARGGRRNNTALHSFTVQFPPYRLEWDPLKKCIEAVNHPERMKAHAAREKWKEWAPAFRSKYEMTFLSKSQIMLLNGNRLITKAPAKILRYFLDGYVKGRRRVFNVSELSTNPDIVSNFLKDPSINVRLIRLQKSLDAKAPRVGIVRKKGTGLIEFQADCELSYREVDE